MYYRHDLKDKYVYPDRSDEHMITVKHLRDTNFDENYQYLPKGFWHGVKRVALWVVLNLVVFPVATIRHGVRIHGKKNYRKLGRDSKEKGLYLYRHGASALRPAFRGRLYGSKDNRVRGASHYSAHR